MKVNKICSKVYTYYLRYFYKTIQFQDHVFIDYRCEIEQKNNISIGQKSILYKYVTMYKNKEGSFIMGDSSHIAPYGYLLIENQSLTIGNNVAIGPFCSIFCSSNAIPSKKNVLLIDSYVKNNIRIGNNVFIGSQCVILPSTVIEDNVVVAANSTVKGRLYEGYLYGGNPAKKIRILNEK